MKQSFAKLSVLIVIVSGVIVLIGYFIKFPFLMTIRSLFLEWALILAAIALFVGVINLVKVHWKKVRLHEKGWLNSLVLLLTLFVVVVIGGYFGPTTNASLWIFNNIQIPIETSLMALLSVVLAYILARLLGRRKSFFNIVFLGTVLFVLLGTVTISGFTIPGLAVIKDWIVQVPSVAGARGIILGVALGTIATGVRILTGYERPYGE